MSSNELRAEYKESIRNVIFSWLGPLGASIDEALFQVDKRLEERRFKEFIFELDSRVIKIEENSLNTDFLNSDEFYDFTRKMFSIVVKNSSKIKYEILANIFFESIHVDSNWEDDIKNIFTKIVDDFSVNHLLVFKFLVNRDYVSNIDSYEDLFLKFDDELSVGKSINKYQFRLYCSEIENKYLIRFSKRMVEIGSNGYNYSPESSDLPNITITDFGKMFIEVLEFKQN